MNKTTVLRGQSNISKVWKTAARVATTLKDRVRDPGRRIVYSEPVLFDLTITFLVVRSFTDKPNGSNYTEHQLSVVKQ
jgi:formate-dependent phosphoribosylglycinamide formyltransferase (GAR transformylase)